MFARGTNTRTMTDNLKQLKDRIESLNQHHQIQILTIVTQNNVAYTENKNGSFVNLTNMDEATISKITAYLKYVDEQETQLNEVENQKTELTKQFFT
jgi:7,8-dihydro-6-hydroxymethylpterin-pyrophosphokinase